MELTSGRIPSPYGEFARGRLLGDWPFEDRINDNREIWFNAQGQITVPTQEMVRALDTVLKFERGGTLTQEEIRTHNAFVKPFLESGHMPYNASHAFLTTAVPDYAMAALRYIPESAALGPDRGSGVQLLRDRAERQRAANAAAATPPPATRPEPEISSREPSRVGDASATRLSSHDPATLAVLQEAARERNAASRTDVVLAYALRDPATGDLATEQIMLPAADARSLVWRLDEAGMLTVSRDELLRANGIGGSGNLPGGRPNTPENNLRHRAALAALDAMGPDAMTAAAQQGALRINGKEGVVFPFTEYAGLAQQSRVINSRDDENVTLVIPRSYRLDGGEGASIEVRGAELFPDLTRREAIALLNNAGGFRKDDPDREYERSDFSPEHLSIAARKREADPIDQVLNDNGLKREVIERPVGRDLDRFIEHWEEEYAKRRKAFPLESEETSRRIILEQIPDETLRSFVEHRLRPLGQGLPGSPSGASMPLSQGAGGGGRVAPPQRTATGPEDEGAGEGAREAPGAKSPFEMPRSLFNPQPEAMAAAMEEWKAIVEEGIAAGLSLEEILSRIGPAAQEFGREIFAGTPIADGYGAPRDSGARTTDLTHRLFESNLEPTLDFVESDWDNVVNARTGEKPSFRASEFRERLEAGDPEVFDLVHLTKIQTPRGEVISAMVTFSADAREGSRGYRVVTAYPSNPETIAKIREGLAVSWKAATEIPPGDPAAVEAAAKFFHDYIYLYWHMHGNDEIGTTLLAGLLASKGFPVERLNPDASLSGGAFQSNREDFAARFANGEFAELGATGGRTDAQPERETQAAPQPPPQRQATSEAVERYVSGGTFTREEFDRVRPLNPEMTEDQVARELAMLKQGFGSGRLVTRAPTPPASAPAAGATPGETVNLGQRPDLVDEAKALLDRAIADAEAPGAANDERVLDRAEVAGQIARHLQRDPDKVLAVLDGEGRVVGLGAYSISRNVFDPSQDGILYAEDLLSFAPSGSGVALSLLQAMYDRAPRGVMRLRSLNEGLDDYYGSLGGQPVTKPGTAGNVLEWRERPAQQR